MTLVLAMVLDAVLGEPKWLWSRLPHPAVLMGRLIGWADRTFNAGQHRRQKGIALIVCLGGLAIVLGLALQALPGRLIDVLVVAVLLAQRSLSDHVLEVAESLNVDIATGRRTVAKIVGRDTADMDESSIARSAIESAAENLSDGVIAPIFWFAIGGLPGVLLYKITNTADSMIGYKTDRYGEFGWAAARFDDFLNLVPARLTALVMAAAFFRLRAFRKIAREAPLHRSPNAGWPEAAMAHVLDIALSGPRSYHGEVRDYPFVNHDGTRQLGPDHIRSAVRVLWRTWALALIAAGLFAWGLA